MYKKSGKDPPPQKKKNTHKKPFILYIFFIEETLDRVEVEACFNIKLSKTDTILAVTVLSWIHEPHI